MTERDAGNHGVSGGPNKCVNGYLEAYLLEGRVPERRAACAPRPEQKPHAPRVGAAERLRVGRG